MLLMIAALFPRQADRQAIALQAEVKPATNRQPAKSTVNPLPRKASEPTEKVNHVRMPKFPKTQELTAKPVVLPTSSPAPEKHFDLSAKMSHSVQVGAFRKRNLAQNLVGALRQKGYPAIILEVTDSKTIIWHTVRIGDFPSLEAAIQNAHEFTSRETMESAVRSFGKL